jgi:hypothetical protein
MMCLVVLGTASRLSAAPITLELTGALNAPPAANAAFAPPYDVFLRVSFDSPAPLVPEPGQPQRYDSYVFPVTLEGSVGGVSFAPFRNASWTQLRDRDGQTHITFEMDFMEVTSFPVEGGYLRAMFLFFDFAPGGFPLDGPFPSQFPVDALTAATGELWFSPPNGPREPGQPVTAGGSSMTFSNVRQVPEPSTLLLVATGLAASTIARRRRGDSRRV